MTASSAHALHVESKATGIETLQLQCVPQTAPSIQSGEVLVQVLAAGVNPSDVKATLGIMPHAVFPRTPGRDFAGVVIEGPAALKGLKVWGSGGDIGITRNGSHARYLVLPVAAVKEAPKGISIEEAGAVGVPFVTACEGFSRAGGVKAGQTVVVLGANGKVGQAAVQIAARAGAKVIAVQRQDHLEGFACSDVEVINSTHIEPATRIMDLTGGKGADLVFNTVDKVYWEVGHAVMAKGATQIFIIATKGQTVAFDLFKFYRGMHNFVGIDTLALDCVRSCELLDELRPGFEDGTLKPFPVDAADMIALPHAMEAYKAVLAGAKKQNGAQAMNITRFHQAPEYKAPNHFDMTCLRLQGHEAGPSKALWMGVSQIQPGGHTGLDGSPMEKHYVVLSGEVTLVSELNGVVTEAVLKVHDSACFAPGEKRQLVNKTDQMASILLAMPYPPATPT